MIRNCTVYLKKQRTAANCCLRVIKARTGMGGWKWPKKQKDAKSPRELLDLNQLARWGSEIYVKKLCGQIDYSGSNVEDGVKGDKIGRKKAG